MALFLAQRWRRQPQRPIALDRSNPIGRRVIAAIMPGLPGPVREIVSGRVDANGAEVSRIAGRDSIAGSVPTTMSIPFYDARLDNNKTFCLYVRGRVSPGATTVPPIIRLRGSSGYGWMFRRGNFSSSESAIWLLGYWWGATITSGRFDFGSYGLGQDKDDGNILASCALSFTSGASVIKQWAGGKYLGTSSGTTDPASIGTGSYLEIADPLGNPSSAFPSIALLALIEGPGDDRLAQELHAAPWQLFRPRRKTVYSLPGAALPTLTLAGVQDVTSSGARPKVTVTF